MSVCCDLTGHLLPLRHALRLDERHVSLLDLRNARLDDATSHWDSDISRFIYDQAAVQIYGFCIIELIL